MNIMHLTVVENSEMKSENNTERVGKLGIGEYKIETENDFFLNTEYRITGTLGVF